MAERLSRANCDSCSRQGTIYDEKKKEYIRCPDCKGTGRIWVDSKGNPVRD